MKGAKEEFRREFQEGTLHELWADMVQGDGFLARWAAHRMAVALKAVDSIVRPPGIRALDIGIGSGLLIRELSRRGCSVFGADFSRSIVRKTRERLKEDRSGARDRVMLADVESLPLKSDAVDLVTCLGVLEYLSGDVRALGEIYRILRPGGHVVLAVASYHRIGNLTALAGAKLMKAFGGRRGGSDRGTGGNGEPENHLLIDRVRMVKPTVVLGNARRAGFGVRSFRCFGGKVFGRYLPFRFFIPGVVYIGDHCLLVLQKPVRT